MWMVLIYQLLYLQYHIKWHVAMDDGITGDDWQVVVAVPIALLAIPYQVARRDG